MGRFHFLATSATRKFLVAPHIQMLLIISSLQNCYKNLTIVKILLLFLHTIQALVDLDAACLLTLPVMILWRVINKRF